MAARLLSGVGNPNGVALGQTGDIFTDVSVGTLYIKTATVWVALQPEPPPPTPPTPTTGFMSFTGGLEIDWSGGGGPSVMPYAPGRGLLSNESGGGLVGSEFGVGFGAVITGSEVEDISWVVTRAGTLTSLRVNIKQIGIVGTGAPGANADFNIRKSLSCNGPFSTVLSITGVTAPGCYDTAGAVAIAPGDRIAFIVRLGGSG